MKITLTNNFHNSSCNVFPKGELEKLFNRQAYRISYATFKRIENKLCGCKECCCGTTRGDKNFRLVKFDYNFRGHGDQSEYYIEVLK